MRHHRVQVGWRRSRLQETYCCLPCVLLEEGLKTVNASRFKSNSKAIKNGSTKWTSLPLLRHKEFTSATCALTFVSISSCGQSTVLGSVAEVHRSRQPGSRAADPSPEYSKPLRLSRFEPPGAQTCPAVLRRPQRTAPRWSIPFRRRSILSAWVSISTVPLGEDRSWSSRSWDS